MEAALYEKTVKSSECIDHKLTELVEALGRISKKDSYPQIRIPVFLFLSQTRGGNGAISTAARSILC